MPENLIEELEYQKFMNIAINMAKRGVGNTSPNPSVGCVIEKDGLIIGRGWTGNGGRPHAETQSIKSVINKGDYSTESANLYVTLEPCSHYGETPPCVNAIVEAGIKKVIIANGDPNPKVAGKGIKFLKENNIEVIENICRKEAEIINAGFFKNILEERPYITLKLAFTGDGKISMANECKSWFTNDVAKSYAHILRYRNDAILVGGETLRDDNPSLTCRFNGLEEFSPKRYIMSNKINEIDKTYNCFPAEILNGEINDIVKYLAVKNGITRMLIEGGGQIAISFLDCDIVDEIHLIIADDIKGNTEADNIRELISEYLEEYNLVEDRNLEDNKLLIYKK